MYTQEPPKRITPSPCPPHSEVGKTERIIKLSTNNMRKVTREITDAFTQRRVKRMGNNVTDGQALFLHGNKIAEWRNENELWITNAGWRSNTTKERLNGLPGVSIYQRNFEWFLSDEPWNGGWIKV